MRWSRVRAPPGSPNLFSEIEGFSGAIFDLTLHLALQASYSRPAYLDRFAQKRGLPIWIGGTATRNGSKTMNCTISNRRPFARTSLTPFRASRLKSRLGTSAYSRQTSDDRRRVFEGAFDLFDDVCLVCGLCSILRKRRRASYAPKQNRFGQFDRVSDNNMKQAVHSRADGGGSGSWKALPVTRLPTPILPLLQSMRQRAVLGQG
jgi:hypothetical protein